MRSLLPSMSYVAVIAALIPSGAHATTTSCNIPQPCAIFANNGGIALQGESAGADGVLGESSSGTIYGAGIEGESLKQTGADAAGAFGLTLLSNGVAPNYGVVAYGSLYGVYGQAGNTGLSSTGPGFGVFGQDNAGSSSGDYNVGVTGLSKYSVGVLAEGSATPTVGYGYLSGDPIGVYAVAKHANGNGFNQSVGFVAESDGVAEIVANTYLGYSVNIADRSYLFNAYTTGHEADTVFTVDYSGNELLNGAFTASGGVTNVHTGPDLMTTGASGKTVTAYSDHTTTPEMDDVGEAHLENGQAFVPIDPALADVIDPHGGYHVFVTPEGDSNGLSVTRGAGGFLVRERRGGRSSLAFDYRVVAKPLEEKGARLPRIVEASAHVESIGGGGSMRPQQIPLPLAPEERLRGKRRAGIRANATESCNGSQPCAVFANNNGIAVEGESASADGVLGESSSGTIYGAGVEGESLKQTGADAAGTFGLTLLSNGVAPNYGVVAYGSLYGVYGQPGDGGGSSTAPGFGVFGQDNAGSKSADYNVGVTGLSKNGVGVLGEGNATPTLSMYGSGIPIGLYAVAKTVGDANDGLIAESDSFGEILENTHVAASCYLANPTFLIEGFANSSGASDPFFSIDYSGDEITNGKVTATGGITSVHGGPYLQTTGASGTTVRAYSDHTTTPELEDVGEAQLVNGRAFVPIDAALADVIDLREGYHVFVTPEGDSKGLYVLKSPRGFLVRERRDGRSALVFAYRIVAKPREENGARLAPVTAAAPHVGLLPAAGRKNAQQISIPLSPEERLKRKIGPRAYAKLMTALNDRFASLSSR